jgi:hypothetical protein
MADEQQTCGFCGKLADKVVEGTHGQYACLECLVRAHAAIAHLQKSFVCSFCGDTVPGITTVEGPNQLYMCSSCVDSGIKLLSK